MKKSNLAAVAALSVACIAPTTAMAAPAPAPPHFTSSYIVPTKSLGGLKLGAPASTATEVFPAKDCTATSGCSYTAPDQSWSISVLYAARTKTSKPFIGDISFTVDKLGSASVPDLKTAGGIGIGSSPAALKHAYPKLLGSVAQTFYTSKKVPLTVYDFTNGRLTSISMRSVQLG